MKTKLFFLCVILIAISLKTRAQIDTFDLSKYKVTDYKRHSLDFSLSTNTYKDVTNSSYKYSNAHDRYDRFTSDINVNYNYRLNTREKQEFLNISTSIIPYNYYYQKDGNPNYYYSKEKQINSNIQFNYNYLNYFYNDKEYFLSIGNTGNNRGSLFIHNYESNINEQYIDRKSEQINLYFSNALILGVGKGRIENIEDARMAVYILDDLIKTKSLTREPSEEEILKFATIITQLKNKRFFDYRIRKIYEIQALDTFLNQTGLISKHDAVYYTSLNDNWTFSNNPERRSGKRLSLNFEPNVNYQENRYSLNTSDLIATKKLGIEITGVYYNTKPLSLKWQFEDKISIGYKKEKYWSNYYLYEHFSNDMIFANATIAFGYYPNSRSYISFSFANQLSKTWTDNKYLLIEDFSYNLFSELNAYYYFSERLKVNLSSGCYIYYIVYPNTLIIENSLRVKPYLQVSLNYALF